MQVATIVAQSELARARVLAASLERALPGATLTALLLDGEPQDEEAFEQLAAAALGVEDFALLAASLTEPALRELCKPPLLERVLERAGGDTVAYLEASSLLLGPLDDVEALARERGMLVRRRTARPLPDDGRRPNEADLDRWGLHDSGLLFLAGGRDHGELLAAWSRWAAGDGATPFERLITLGAGAGEIDDPGVGLSFWDMQGRNFAANGVGVTVDGAPLRLMRFPAFEVAAPDRIASVQDRLRARDMPGVAGLCERYAQLLREAGEERQAELPYAYGRLADGTRLDHRLRAICRAAAETGALRASPFAPEGLEELYRWLAEPAAAGREFGINRLCMLVREQHDELREAYPDLDRREDAHGMIEWIHEHGVREGALPASVVPPSSPQEREAQRRRAARVTNLGVNVVGYLTAEMGLGEGHRLIVDSLDAAGVPLLPMLPPTMPPSRLGHPYATVPLNVMGFPVNLICVNGDGLERFRDEVGSGFFRDRHNVGLWWWEVDVLPPEWLRGFELLDEIWVGSDHVADAIGSISPIPVHRIRFPIARPAVARSAAATGDGEWSFLCMFDYHSVIERKNPLAVIEAFKRAFAPGDGALLVLKAINAEDDPAGRARVLAAAAGQPHIRIVEEHLSRSQADALIDSADCIVSLHRAEGFGHVLAEAMALGKPVVATAYSGNLDFMTSENSYLVDYSLREVGPGCWPYPADAHWAEPDVEDAARVLRAVFDDQAGARARGALAAASLARTHSLELAGRSMRRRIESVTERWEGPPYLPPLRSAMNITLGSKGRLLRRLFPGLIASLEREFDHLWEANDQRAFDIDAAARGPLLSTLAATLATLRRVERGDAPRD